MAGATNDNGPSDDEVRLRVIAALAECGVRELGRRLGMHPQTVLAIAASIPVRRGSLALAERYFREHGQLGKDRSSSAADRAGQCRRAERSR